MLHGLELTIVRPFHVAAWIEDFSGSKPTVKQKLAAVRMLYDFPEEPFDSIAVSYLLHCLPGPVCNKAILFKNLAPLLSDTGVLFGSTILGAEADHNRLGRQLMQIYNRKGVFSNEDDRFEDLPSILTRQFQNVRMEQQGVVALFSASFMRK